MEDRQFRKPKTADEERKLIENSVPHNTQHNTKWAVKLFKEWQLNRADKIATAFSLTSISLDITKVQNLDTPLEDMTAETLNVWLSRFMQEVSNRNGKRYPAKTLYLLACGIKRHLSDKTGHNPFGRGDKRLVITFIRLTFP